MFLAETIGVNCTAEDSEYIPEWVARHLAGADDESGYNTFDSMMAVSATTIARLSGTLRPTARTAFAK